MVVSTAEAADQAADTYPMLSEKDEYLLSLWAREHEHQQNEDEIAADTYVMEQMLDDQQYQEWLVEWALRMEEFANKRKWEESFARGEEEQVQDLCEWLKQQEHRYKIIIAGYHDITCDTDCYLQRGGQRFHGSTKYLRTTEFH